MNTNPGDPASSNEPDAATMSDEELDAASGGKGVHVDRPGTDGNDGPDNLIIGTH